MEISEFLSSDAVCELREPDKASALREVSRRSAALLGLDAQVILQALTRREDLGSTGMGSGIAIPHARLDAVERPFGLFALLRPPLPFDAVDERPVDLLFLVLLPEQAGDAQLKPLACVARRLRDRAFADALRKSRGSAALFELLTRP